MKTRTPSHPGRKPAWFFLLCFAAATLALPLPGGGEARGGAGDDSCLDCHRDPTFRATNKKLYDYYQNWELSVHGQEGIGCADCHGGNPKEADKKKAHQGSGMRASEPGSPVSYENVPKTCAQCHDDTFESYRKSKHYEHVLSKENEQEGPNCVTCHESVSTSVLNVNTVRKTCEHCHNKKSDNNPDIPDRAETVLNQFLSIHRFYRYFTKQADRLPDRSVFANIEEQTTDLFVEWHTFDLDQIETRTRALLDFLKAKRLEVRDQLRGKRQPK